MLKKMCVGMTVAVIISLAGGTAMAGSTNDVNLDMVLDTASSAWQVFLSITGTESLGLSGINFTVSAEEGNSAIVDSKSKLPSATETTDFASFFVKGFKIFMEDGPVGIGGAQDSLSNKFSDFGTGNDSILTGLGLTEVTESNGDIPDVTFDFPLLVAEGTYSGDSGKIVVNGSSASTTLIPLNFVDGSSYATFSPDSVFGSSAVIPEPATAALIAVSGIGLMLRRRIS